MIGPPRGSQDRPVGRYGVTVVVHPKRSIGAHCTPRPPLRHETRPRVARTHDLTESARSVGQEQRSQFVARQRPHLSASRPAARRWSGGASRGRGEARRTVLSLDLIRHDCVCHDPAGPDGATAPARAGPSATGTPPTHTLSACPRSHHGARSASSTRPRRVVASTGPRTRAATEKLESRTTVVGTAADVSAPLKASSTAALWSGWTLG